MPEQFTAKMPNPMTEQELIDAGKSPEEAKTIMRGRVFGADHKTDERGKPVEQGIGSEANPFKATHIAALELANAKKKALAGGANPADIAAIVAAVMTAMKAQAEEDKAKKEAEEL